MKKLKLWQKAGLIGILTAAFLAGPTPGIRTKNDSKPAEVTLSMPAAISAEKQLQETEDIKKDLEHITLYCLVKGTPHEVVPMKYMELWSKTGEGKARKLYFEVYYSNSEKGISASQVRFVESEFEIAKGGTDIPHNYMSDSVFAVHKDKDRFIITQRMIADGGYGPLDGNADIMKERTAIETTDKVVIDVADEPDVQDKEKIKKTYEGFIKEILEITGKEEIKQEGSKAMYQLEV